MRLLPRRRGMKDLGPSVDLPINKRLARLAEYPLVVSMAAAALIVNATYGRVPRLVDDSAHYIAIAQGKATTVRAPFSHRILHPFAAQLLATVAHRDLATGFSVVAYISCFALLLLVALTLRRWGVRPILCFPVLLTPLLLDMTLDAYLPDLFHASLMAGFFYCFGTGKKATAWVLLLAATLARETTLVLCFVILLLEWLWGRRKAALAALAAGIIGIAASWLVVSHSQPDIHGLGSFAYLALKVPYNVLKNWLGVMLWVNTCGWKCSLAYSINLPGWLHLGNIDKVGVCPWEPGTPLRTILIVLTEFGLMGTLALRALAPARRSCLNRMPEVARLSYWYGVVAFILGTATGANVSRLVGYGWPAFWLGAPLLLMAGSPLRPRSLPIFMLAHSALCWMPAVATYLFGVGPLISALQIGVALAAHALAWRSLTPEVSQQT